MRNSDLRIKYYYHNKFDAAGTIIYSTLAKVDWLSSTRQSIMVRISYRNRIMNRPDRPSKAIELILTRSLSEHAIRSLAEPMFYQLLGW